MKNTRLNAWIGLIINLLIIPGGGSFASGQRKKGIVQIILSIIGLIPFNIWLAKIQFEYIQHGLFYIEYDWSFWCGVMGAIILFISLIWSIITSIKVFISVSKNYENQTNNKN